MALAANSAHYLDDTCIINQKVLQPNFQRKAMIAEMSNAVSWKDQIHEQGRKFRERASSYDAHGTFVEENYRDLKAMRYFSSMIPRDLGGGGTSHAEMCETIRILGTYCGSTALAFSMHQHLIAAAVWKLRHKGIGAQMLGKVSDQQLVLVSTGARDWLGSNGDLQKVSGGYRFSAKKFFASQSSHGNIAVTSAPFQETDGKWSVLHFPVSLAEMGVSILDDWDVMGMRATGSQTIVFEDVFVSESAIALRRPRDEFHPAWSVVLTVALPLIMSAYIGIAERAAEIAVTSAQKIRKKHAQLPLLVGKLHNAKIGMQCQWRAMLALANNFDFSPNEETTVDMLSLKTNVAEGAMDIVAQAMEIMGGASFYRKNEIERLFRDVHAAQFHPLPKWEQYQFTGERLIA